MLDMEQLVDEEPSFYPTSSPKSAKRKLNGKCRVCCCTMTKHVLALAEKYLQ
jgi:hypothetical protein